MFIAAPSGPMTAKNFKAARLKLSRSDPETRGTLLSIGLSTEMLERPDFDLKAFLLSENFKFAYANAMGSEEGLDLLAKAATLTPGSDEMARVHGELVRRFGLPHIKSLIDDMPL